MNIDGDILALDVSSSRTGIARGRPGARPFLSCREFTGVSGDIHQRHNMAFGSCLRWCAEAFAIRPSLVVIEAPLVRTGDDDGMYRAMLMLGLTAVIRSATNTKQIPCELAAIGTWRKYVLGNGNMPDAKRETLAKVRSIGIDAKNNDEGDAAGVWLWACKRFAGVDHPELLPLLGKASAGVAA